MGNSNSSSSSSIAGSVIKVVVVAGAAAAAAALAWRFTSKNTDGIPKPPDRSPETAEEQTSDQSIEADARNRIPTVLIPHPYYQGMMKIMTYNIWHNKYVRRHARMKAISKLILKHSPDIILLQEMSPDIYKYFQSCDWWDLYNCSVQPEKATKSMFCILLSKLPVRKFFYKKFDKDTSSKGIAVASIITESNKKFLVATCHLKSPNPPDMYITERASQANEALKLLDSSPNVVLGGDMNWDENCDGPFPLLSGWNDAWCILKTRVRGYTYNTESNGMLACSRTLQKRLDRFICKLKDFEMIHIEMIGKQAIPGVWYKSNGQKLPVLPSDHYGLILYILPKK